MLPMLKLDTNSGFHELFLKYKLKGTNSLSLYLVLLICKDQQVRDDDRRIFCSDDFNVFYTCWDLLNQCCCYS